MTAVRLVLASVLLAAAWSIPARAQDGFCPSLQDKTLIAPAPASIEGAEPHVYRTIGSQDLRLHIVRPPAGTATGAAAVAYSIAGWNFGRVDGFLPQARQLAARGLTVILADVRNHCRDGAIIVDEVEDAKAALRWVRAHAAELGLDPQRIAALGGSAGGHLALSTAMFAQFDHGDPAGSRPDLLLLFFPCVDPTAEIEQQYSAAAIAGRGAEVSPLLHVAAGLPPMLILQGTDDPLYADVNSFCAKARAARNACDYAEYEGAKHGFFRPGNAHYDAAFARLDAYLVEAGYLAR